MTHALFCCIPGQGFSALGTAHENKMEKECKLSTRHIYGTPKKKNLTSSMPLLQAALNFCLPWLGKSQFPLSHLVCRKLAWVLAHQPGISNCTKLNQNSIKPSQKLIVQLSLVLNGIKTKKRPNIKLVEMFDIWKVHLYFGVHNVEDARTCLESIQRSMAT